MVRRVRGLGSGFAAPAELVDAAVDALGTGATVLLDDVLDVLGVTAALGVFDALPVLDVLGVLGVLGFAAGAVNSSWTVCTASPAVGLARSRPALATSWSYFWRPARVPST